jgi:hypothetical protein
MESFDTSSPAIVLATLNAKYIHASLGLRYLLANMARHGGADLRQRTLLREFTIARKPQEVAQELLALHPKIIGLGVYIWNVTQTCEVVRLLKAARPGLKVVLGGPEVSHEWRTSRTLCAGRPCHHRLGRCELSQAVPRAAVTGRSP